jgi:hypothetical protein
MNRKTQSHHISQTSFTSSLDISRRIAIRRRLIESKRTNQSQDLNNTQNISSNIRNTVSNISRAIINDENNSLISNQTNINNTYINSSPSVKKKIGKRENSLYLSEKIVLNKIEENKPIEQNINSEIKDTVKCYICHNIITKPKMCQFCHRIACEKCLYNWFIIEQKQNCSYCHEKANFSDMISVPFMSTIADFVEKVFEKEEKEEEISDDNNKGFCPDHIKEQMHYYCLNCNRGYCKICFVFFGKEKDKHVNHNIILYEQYKTFKMSNLMKYEEIIDEKIKDINDKVKLCESYKELYEFERNKGNKFIEVLKNEFNHQINANIRIIDNQIKLLKSFISKYDKYKSELSNFYSNFYKKETNKENSNNFIGVKNISFELIDDLPSIISEKIYSKEDIDKLFELSKEIHVNTYQSELCEFKHDNIVLTQMTKLGDSPYELIIKNSQRKEIFINLVIPKDKISFGHNFTSFVFVKKKENEVKSYELKEEQEDENFIYFQNKIPWDYIGISDFQIKGFLYDFYFV